MASVVARAIGRGSASLLRRARYYADDIPENVADAAAARAAGRSIAARVRHSSSLRRESFDAAVGNTPLLRLRGPSEATGCEIYGKCEFMNPAGSVKDRAALGIIQRAEREGLLAPGSTVVEGTAGNTGIGLTAVANTRGLRTVIVIPETQTKEKKDALRQLGARLVEVPAAPYRDPNNYIRVSERLANELGGFWAQQFDNTANRDAHYATTGPEIWAQTEGRVDAFSCAVGTGGTLAGTAAYLREVSGGRVKIGLTDPPGAALFRYYRDGELASEGDSITEGVGQGRITGNLEGFAPDAQYEIPDARSLEAAYELMRDEGLALGLSSGLNVAGAMEVARDLAPGSTVVTILCDGASRYASKMFNVPFLLEKGLPVPPWLADDASGDVEDALRRAIQN